LFFPIPPLSSLVNAFLPETNERSKTIEIPVSHSKQTIAIISTRNKWTVYTQSNIEQIILAKRQPSVLKRRSGNKRQFALGKGGRIAFAFEIRQVTSWTQTGSRPARKAVRNHRTDGERIPKPLSSLRNFQPTIPVTIPLRYYGRFHFASATHLKGATASCLREPILLS
jgi:hypothetical protein